MDCRNIPARKEDISGYNSAALIGYWKIEIGESLSTTDRQQFREWLAKNHQIKKEIWLVIYKKPSGKPTISYNEIVEEALCFG